MLDTYTYPKHKFNLKDMYLVCLAEGLESVFQHRGYLRDPMSWMRNPLKLYDYDQLPSDQEIETRVSKERLASARKALYAFQALYYLKAKTQVVLDVAKGHWGRASVNYGISPKDAIRNFKQFVSANRQD